MSVRTHVIHGDNDGDLRRLNNAAAQKTGVREWTVPKTAMIGDRVILYVGPRGFYATAHVRSIPVPRAGWHDRYGAALGNVTLIIPPISLAQIKKAAPEFIWTNYPRSITTPSPKITKKLEALIAGRRKGKSPVIADEGDILELNLEEKLRLALEGARENPEPREGTRKYWLRSVSIREYAKERAGGCCEECEAPAPFIDRSGKPYLEVHHVTRLTDGGPDHPRNVPAVCPTCHRRAHHGEDHRKFNAKLKRRAAMLYRKPR